MAFDLAGEQVQVDVVLVRGIERVEPESFPPRTSRFIQGGDDDCATARSIVEVDGGGEDMGDERVPTPSPAWDRSTASRPISTAGNGSGAYFATDDGAPSRSMLAIARLTNHKGLIEE